MSSFGTATTVERIDVIGTGDSSPGLVFRASSAVSLLGFSFAWSSGPRTELRVDDYGLTASGDLGGPRQGTLRLPWSRVHELHYAPAGNGEIGGVYAREGAWCSRCILARLTEAQADEVIAVVASRYPLAVPFAGNNVRWAVPDAALHPVPPTAWRPAIQPPR